MIPLQLLAVCALASAPVPAPLAAAVVDSIAARWRVPAERVCLEWRALPPGTHAGDGAALVRLAPAGGARWAVTTTTAAGAPLRLELRAGTAATALVATHPLSRNVVLAAADVRDTTIVHWGVPDTAPTPQPGWTTRRVIAAGEVLRRPAVVPAPLVAHGDTVAVVWRRGAVSLTMRGVAANDAALGEQVWVRLDARRRMSGTVAGRALVHVTDHS